MEPEPWEYKQNDDRSADGLILYLIFCEGAVSEVQYFKMFKERSQYKVNVVGGFNSKHKHVSKVIDHCIKANVIDDLNGVLNFNREQIHIWCVYDNDIFRKDNDLIERMDFRMSVESATRIGFNVAWSNDAFEIWLLLHFYSLDDVKDLGGRENYFPELTKIFKSPAERSKFFGSYLESHAFSYENHLKKDRAFKEIALPILRSNVEAAITRAKELHEYQESIGRVACDEQLPCTLVYRLVEELLEISESY